MGTTSSKASRKKKNDRTYLLPADRAKDRFILTEHQNTSALFDPSVDKYDLLIIFPLTAANEKPKTTIRSFLSYFFDIKDEGTVTWEDFQKVWKNAIPGTQKEKENGVRAFEEFWRKRMGSFDVQKDFTPSKLKTIVRDAIVDKLATKGLQIKLTATKSYIFCRVRAPIRLLEVQADQDNYPLQIRGEIDPGSKEFWNQLLHGRAIEVEEEQREYSLEESKTALEKLYRAGKISAADTIINTKEETRDARSLRIHALERIADKVPVYNKYLAYISLLSGKPHLRYLFQTYPSVRGMTLFKTKDRLALTKSIIETCFDMDVLVSKKLVVSFMSLHDANRGEKLTVTSLAQKWTTFWSVAPNELGAPTVTHSAYDEDSEVYFFERPFSQPLADIRDYFGEKVAMYYAWLGHFTYFLLTPAILAALIEVYYSARGSQVLTSGLDWATYAYAFLVMTWAMVYIQCWKRECYAVALKWGTRGFENEEKPRPQFDGESRRSPVTSEMEIYFPESTRSTRALVSWSIIFAVTLVSMLVILGVYYLEFISDEYVPSLENSWWMTFIVSLLVAVTIQFNSIWFLRLAKTLNNIENYRTDTDYEDNLVIKMIVFEVFNSFGAAAFVAYGKEYVFGNCYDNCMVDLRTLLYAMIIVRVVKSSSEMIFATLGKPLKDATQFLYATFFEYFHRQFKHWLGLRNQYFDDSEDTLLSENEDDKYFLKEIDLKPFPSTFVDSSAVFFQFAFINLFSIIVPLLSIVSLFENLLKIRVDAFKLCHRCRRPHVEQAEDAGFWSETMEYMVYLGIYMNSALVSLAFPDVETYSFGFRAIAFLLLSQVLVLYVLLIKFLIPDEPEFVREIAERQEFVINKYVKGQDSDPVSSIKQSSSRRDRRNGPDEGVFAEKDGQIDDVIDIDALQLFDLRRGQKLSDKDFEDIGQLEKRRRELMARLQNYHERLQELHSTETFNETTGMGETKFGLALGRLSVRIDEVLNIDQKYQQFKVRVEVVAEEGSKVNVVPLQALPVSLTDSSWRAFSIHDSYDGRRHYKPAHHQEQQGRGGRGVGAGMIHNPAAVGTGLGLRSHSNSAGSAEDGVGVNVGADRDAATNNSRPVMATQHEPIMLGPFAPIKTMYAKVRLSLFLAERAALVMPQVLTASVEVPLRSINSQVPQELMLSLTTGGVVGGLSRRGGSAPLEIATIKTNMVFQYSKIVPLREKILRVQGQLQLVEEGLTRLMAGKFTTSDVLAAEV